MGSIQYNAMPFTYKLARFSLLLLKAYPFLGELCMRIEKFRETRFALAATDGLRLFYNPDAMDKLPEESFNFVLLHELLHIMLLHRYPKGMPFYEKAYWNIGFDLVVNWLLTDMDKELKRHGLPIIPVSGSALCSDDLSEDPSETIAKAFVEQAVKQGISSQNPPRLVDIKWRSFECTVVHDGLFIFDILGGDDIIDPSTEAEIRGLLTGCEKSAGKNGLPWQLSRLWEGLKQERSLPWFLILKRYLEGMKESDESDFYPPDKRMLYRELMLPSEAIESGSELENALLVLDVSSSVDREELLTQIWQINSLLNGLEFHGSIISFGSSVYQEARLSDRVSLKKFIDGLESGGGTDWDKVVDYVRQKKQRAKPIIVFTDGYFYHFTEGLPNVIFIVRDESPEALHKLGKVIRIN